MLRVRSSCGRSSGRGGIETTQATLSRDIRDLGLVKAAVDGAYRRGLGASGGGDAEAAVRRAIDEYLRSFEQVEQLLVLKTDPGQAQALAIALDRSGLPDVVGTIAGDDTILVICRSAAHAWGELRGCGCGRS